MVSKKLAVLLVAAATFGQSMIMPQNTAWARGGGGGFGGGRGGFGGGFGGGRMGGDFDRGGFDRGFDRGPYDGYGGEGEGDDGMNRDGDRGFDNSRVGNNGFGDNGLGNGLGRGRTNDALSQAPSESNLRRGADMEYGNQHPLATDGGFGRLASTGGISNYERAGNYTHPVGRQDLALRGDAIRDGYRYPDAFDRGWWGRYPYGWGYPGWGGGWAWGCTGWPELAGFWGMSAAAAPIEYDYGNSITYQNDNVYYGSQQIEPAATYYDQAQTLANSVPVPNSSSNVLTKAQAKDWKPLGVFSLTQGTETNTTTMFQLAINKKGAIRGNYYNTLTQEVKPVKGSVDKKIMRAAWTVGGNKNVVYDTGMANLLQPQSTVLVHMGKSLTQQWTLVRLAQPKSKTS
jgi:hypothetical protein